MGKALVSVDETDVSSDVGILVLREQSCEARKAPLLYSGCLLLSVKVVENSATLSARSPLCK